MATEIHIPQFRAWLKIEQRMYRVCTLYPLADKQQVELEGKSLAFAFTVGVDVELMQSMNMQDRNAKELFEGDILLIGNHLFGRFNAFYPPVYVKKRHDRWVFASQDGGRWSFQDSYFGIDPMLPGENMIEVIGNIHETPHLLERKEEQP